MTSIHNLSTEQPPACYGNGDTYIGRPGKGHTGYFGNPFHGQGSREDHVAQFRRYAEGRVEHDPEYRERVKALHGQRLWCFCTPQACHGDVLAELAMELHEEDAARAYQDSERAHFQNTLFASLVQAGAQEVELPVRQIAVPNKIILGTGGRRFGIPPKDVQSVTEVIRARQEKKALFAMLAEEDPDVIIEGGATGADTLFREWGEAHGKTVWTYPAPWEEFRKRGDPHWKRAGIERNWKMADVLASEREAGHDCFAIACPGGRGTQSMIDILNLFEFSVREVTLS
jgi:hypothetical protein